MPFIYSTTQNFGNKHMLELEQRNFTMANFIENYVLVQTAPSLNGHNPIL